MMKSVLRMIGVASLIGSAACLPNIDQPAAQQTVPVDNNPSTSAVQGTGDSTTISPLTPAQQTAIWMQGGDPTLLANRAYDEGPIDIASQKHSCQKMHYDAMGRLLLNRGVAIAATLPVTLTTACAVPTTSDSQSAASVYCNSRLTLGIPQYAARLGEATSITSGTGTKMMDLYATAATEIETKLTAGGAFPAAATACMDTKTGAAAIMFNADNSCNEAGITCLQGYPATPDQISLCSSIVSQGKAVTTPMAISAITAGRRLAIAVILAGTQLCE